MISWLHNSTPDSRYARAILGEDALWTLSNHLLATVADRIAGGNWQRGGGKGGRPKPIRRPGTGGGRTTYGGKHGRTNEEVTAALNAAAGR